MLWPPKSLLASNTSFLTKKSKIVTRETHGTGTFPCANTFSKRGEGGLEKLKCRAENSLVLNALSWKFCKVKEGGGGNGELR
jgi:hypothetical protein